MRRLLIVIVFLFIFPLEGNADCIGQGTFTFADGDEYVGQFKYGKRNGQGTATFTDGTKYAGQWKNGELIK